MKKIYNILILVLVILLIFSTFSFGNNIDGNKFKPSGNPNDPELTSIGQKIIGVAQLIGTMLSVGVLAILGIQIMLASPEQKANIKTRLIPYIIGAVMVFAIVNILGIVYKIFN